MKTVPGRFGIEQDGIVFPRIRLVGASTSLIVPDNFTLETSSLGIRADAEYFVQDDLRVVGGMPVEVYVEASMLC